MKPALMLGLAIANLALAPFPNPGPELLLLLAVVLWLEYQAVPLPSYGWFSAGSAVALALVGVPGYGPAVATAVLLAGLLLRWAVKPERPKEGTSWLLNEALVGVVSLTCTVVWLRLSLPGGSILTVVAAAVYYLLSEKLLGPTSWLRATKDIIPWNRARRSIQYLRLFTLVGAVGLSTVLADGLGPGWLLLLLFPVSHTAVGNAIFRVFAHEAHQAVTELVTTKKQVRATRKALSSSEKKRRLLEGFARHLAEANEVEPTYDQLLATVEKLVSAEEIALVSRRPELGEHPLVRRARSEGQAVRARSQDEAGLALPFGGDNVLVLLRRGESFSAGDEADLQWLLDKAELALESALRHRSNRLAQYALRERVTLLAQLHQGTVALGASLVEAEILEALGEMLAQILPHDLAWLCYHDHQLERGSLPRSLTAQKEALLGAEVVHTEVPGASLIGIPLVAESQVLGGILLASAVAEAYTIEHLNLLRTIGYQASLTLANAAKYHQVVAARADLEAKQAELVQKQEQLIQSSKMTAIGTMVAGVAHELNTPLGALSLAVEAASLQVENRPGEALKKLEVAEQAVERMQTLIDRLLVYSRRSAEDRLEAVELSVVARDALTFTEHQWRLDEIEATLELTPVPAVSGKATELQQVVINLLLNAVEALRQAGGGPLRVFTRSEPGWSSIGVQDGGVGIPPENLSRIFDPFFTTQEVGRGTGLGLSVSLEIVEGHGGRLTVDSEPGRGSMFLMSLPWLQG